MNCTQCKILKKFCWLKPAGNYAWYEVTVGEETVAVPDSVIAELDGLGFLEVSE